MKILSIVLATAVLLAANNEAKAGAKGDWARAHVGQTAYLNTISVCRDYGEMRDFEHNIVKDCTHRHPGDLVVITDIGSNDSLSSDERTVGIRAKDGSWIGWVKAMDLAPVIPAGTRFVLDNSDGNMPTLYLHHDGGAHRTGIEIGSPVTVLFIKRLSLDDPTADCDFYVRVLNEPKAGLTGWTCDTPTIEGTNLSAMALN